MHAASKTACQTPALPPTLYGGGRSHGGTVQVPGLHHWQRACSAHSGWVPCDAWKLSLHSQMTCPFT